MKIHQNMAAVWLDLVARLVPGDKFVISHLDPIWSVQLNFNSHHIKYLDTCINTKHKLFTKSNLRDKSFKLS